VAQPHTASATASTVSVREISMNAPLPAGAESGRVEKSGSSRS
jgi:hypothetical protein